MRSLNKAMLIGNLGTDPELRHTSSGLAVTTFSLATNEVRGGRDGQPGQERTEWHRIVAWGRLAEICNEYLRKGRQIYVEGRIQTREWTDKQGAKRYTTEIVANDLVMLGGRGEGAPVPAQAGGARSSRPEMVAADDGGTDVGDPGRPEFIEDDNDLPF